MEKYCKEKNINVVNIDEDSLKTLKFYITFFFKKLRNV